MAAQPFLIFDLDGTLVDSMGDIHIAANLLLAEYGLYALDADALLPCIGKGVRFLVENVLEAAGWTGGDLSAAVARYRVLYGEHALDTTAPYPGVGETLDRLAHLEMAVVSNKPEEATRGILQALGLADYFSVVAGGDSFPEMKPSPLPLIRVMEAADAHPSRSWMIGDSVYDIEAGKAAGTGTVAVTWGFQAPEKLKALTPDRVVNAFAEIGNLFSAREGDSRTAESGTQSNR